MLEKAFQKQVVAAAKLFRWRIYHTWRPIHSPAGFPDLVFLRPPRLVLAELKSSTGKPTDEQTEWLDELRQVTGIETYLWRPEDWDTVIEVLK